MTGRAIGFVLSVVMLMGSTPVAPTVPYARHHAIRSNGGMVATQDSYATQVGIEVLKKGGNAIDAAYAIGYALAVTHPQAGNLGGGGFMLIYHQASGQSYALDYRETAPAAAHRDLFLKSDGTVDTQKARFSIQSVGVPGTVAGLEAAHRRFGQLDRASLLKPAIKLAKKGIVITAPQADSFHRYRQYLQMFPATKAVFFSSQNTPYQAGDRWRQPALARTLTLLKRKGEAAFYTGEIAQQITAFMQQHQGLITQQDLANYRVKWRECLVGQYRGHTIVSMPPPSSGGVALIETLNILEGFNIKAMGHNSAQAIHHLAASFKRAYADRATYLGDPDFVDVPVSVLTSKAYGTSYQATIHPTQATPASAIGPQQSALLPESNDTTHFVVVDREGNAVSNTYTLNFSYGNGMVIPALGFLLNNEMDDFSAKPGVPNAYGLIGNEKNSIAPHKRMLSSMTPTFVFKDSALMLATGSPGGSRIISTVVQVISNIIDHDMSVAEAVAAVRVHHQWQPDVLRVERGLSRDTTVLLQHYGYSVAEHPIMGSAQSIYLKNGEMHGVADPRTPSAQAAGI